MSIFRKNKLLSVSPSIIEEGLEGKQDKLSNAPAYSTPADSDALCDVVLSDNKVKRITFANLWTWVLTKIAAVCEKGIQVSSGKIGHSNSITVPTVKRILQATYDAQGHVTAIENEFNWSNTYNTSAENQLFTRKGANAMYSALKYSKNSSVVKIGDGLEIHIETGVSVPQSGTETKNFATAFPNNCWAVIATPAQPGYGANAVVHASVNSKSKYKISQAGGVAVMGVTIIAFGN
jgi:hypothetical protein